MPKNHLYDGIFTPHSRSQKTFLHTPHMAYSCAAFTALTNRIANLLVARGVQPGDRVAAQAGKSVTLLALYAATIKAGAVYLPLNTDYTASELDYFINDAGPRIVVVDDAARDDALEKSAAGTGAEMMTLNQDESGSLAAAAKDHEAEFEAVPRSGSDLAAILYTSGTTGRSKGAKLTHNNLLSNARVLESVWRFTREDTLLHMLPIYHTHGLFVASNLLAMVGGAMIFLPKFSVDAALEWLPRATTMMGVPTFYTRLLATGGFTGELSAHMRLFISGSAPLLAETHIQFQKRTGMAILERYGMTETSMSTSNPFEGERRAGTVGHPLPGIEMRIADTKTGRPAPAGEVGIIELRGDNVFSGYWRMPEKTKEAFTDDGFFITGDMAVRDDDGYITIVGRDKDLIISGGLNVYPKEVEGFIDAIAGVVESAVIGVPHPDLGEAVVAIVVRDDDTVEAGGIESAVSGRIARFKQPKSIRFVDALPRNSMGKVQKNILRQTHAKLFA